MSVIFILIACSLLLAGSFLGAFLWASHSGQFEDDYTPSIRILFEDEAPSVASKSISNKPNDQCQKTTKK
ncbi:cbb3-type cytochrome oxidase assembly protein CcoS [Ekhidna sp.]|uniref:cbb3-type cytochrome oxidase assembly protein CcoS n=1 Tax=Ekhidna sp. TaxID=2608089 RepID=UPI003299687C